MHQRDPSKRIPKSLGTDAKLFGSYTLTDLAVAVSPGVIVILLTQVVFPPTLRVSGYSLQLLTLPLAAVGIICGVIFVYLTPWYTTSLDWFGMFLGFHRSDADLDHEAAKEYTQIKRVHPDQGAIERTDGTFLGLIHVSPPTMALATDDEWAEKAEAFQDFCNTVVEFPIQIYSTTQPFPVDEYLAHYESRLNDPDVKANPKLAALLEHYVEWYRADLDERQMTIRDHYVLVPVSPEEVQFERESLTQKLAALPVLGVFIEAWFAPRVTVQRAAMFDALDERLRQVEFGLRDIDGCGARGVSVEDATRVVAEFWAGEPREYGNLSQVLRTRPLVGRVE